MVTKRKNAGTRDRPESGAPTTAGLDGEAREHAGDGRPASGASDPPELKSLDARVGELLRSELWDDAQEERYDRFTRLAARIFDAPAALILLFDAHRHLFKSRFGFQLGRESQELELCRQAGAQGTPFVIEDLAPGVDSSADTAVSQPRNIRFFAGQALCADNGEVVGCVALMDFKARGFDVNARHTLVELALLVEEEFNLNAAMASTRAGMAELLDRDAALPSATHIIAYEKIELLVEQAGNAGRKLGIFYLSLDNLYDMSLAYGPGRIQAMINRWMDGLRNHSENLIYIGRLSERGFVGAFEFEGDVRAGRRLCEQLRTHAQQEVEHEELRFSFEASAGLCVSPDHGDSGVALIGRAQLAHENQSWNNETSLFNAAIAKRFRRRSALRTRFEAAVEDGSVYFHGQPIFANEDGALVGIELLARWQDPELGEVSPNEFVPVIDPEKGPRHALVAAALDTACRCVAAWQARSQFVPYITINVSGAELFRQDFHELVEDRLAHHGVSAEHLVFELTERSVIRDFELMARSLRRLTDTGARIALDDFGSGYSSIAYLTRLPISIVKLDKRVVQQIDAQGPAEELAQGIVALAHGQQLVIVAEGVETQAQWETVRAMGCEYTQGFLLGRPQSEDALLALIAEQRSNTTKQADPETAPG